MLPAIFSIHVTHIRTVSTISAKRRSEMHHNRRTLCAGTRPIRTTNIQSRVNSDIIIGIFIGKKSTIIGKPQETSQCRVIISCVLLCGFPFATSWQSIAISTRSYYPFIPLQISSLPFKGIIDTIYGLIGRITRSIEKPT